MAEIQPFRLLSTAEYQRLSVEEKLRYLELAFRQSCAADSAPAISPQAAEQSAAAESKI